MKNIMLGITAVGVIMLMTQCGYFGKKVKTEMPVLMDREIVKIDTLHRVYSSQDLQNGVVKGDWAIESVFGKKPGGSTAPFLKFDISKGTVYGNSGCNYINGSYKYSTADSTIVFSNLITTMRMCAADNLMEAEINQALSHTQFYTWDFKDSQHHIYLLDESRQLVMILMHQNFEFLNGAWIVINLDGQSVEDSNMKLVFDIDEMKVHGNTGCNILNGSLETNIETANAISFQQLTTTRMACPDMSKEMTLFVALEETTYIRPTDKTHVQFLDSRDKVVMELQRMTSE